MTDKFTRSSDEFAHLPKGEHPKAESSQRELSDAIRRVIHEHTERYSDADRPLCPSCVATSIYNGLIAFNREEGWNASEKFVAAKMLRDNFSELAGSIFCDVMKERPDILAELQLGSGGPKPTIN